MDFRAIFYDTETTGIRIGKDRIIEIAAYDSHTKKSFSTFIDPECPIPAEATAIHHITDAMVKGAPKVTEALQNFSTFCEGPALLIAHNNDAFDKPMLEAEFIRGGLTIPAWKYLDTLKWARKYRPDLPKHTLQFLREVYGIAPNQAHRALDDVMVLADVLSRMIGDLNWETIVRLVSQASDVLRMPFGKHAGKPLAEVPKDYVLWLNGSGAFDKKENENLKKAFITVGHLT
ncbi:MAG: hypothetical protein RL235_1150 [Chlamydiota bacterium]